MFLFSNKPYLSKEHIQYSLIWNNYISTKNNHEIVYEEHQYFIPNGKNH